MDEYLSDLTDYEGDDGEQTQKMKTAPPSYKIRGALQAPRATSYSTRHLYEMLEDHHIDLDAEYQRDVVWPTSKQIGLIDSLFRNFYIPPVIFATTEEDTKICIDGKQRLSSIWAFMQGKIPFRDPETNQKFYYAENSDRADRGVLLPDNYRKIFQNKQIVCVEYSNLSDANEREIFQRVQLGMALTPAERLQAVSSPMSQFIRALLRDYVNGALAETLLWDTSRAADFRCLCVAVNIFDKDFQGSKGSKQAALPTIQSLTKWLQESFDPDTEFCEDVRSTFEIFVTMARTPPYKACFNLHDKDKQLKVAPAEFIMIAYLIHKLKRRVTMKQLSEAIRKMRWNIREIEKDIRMNGRVLKHMITFVDGLKPNSLKPDPSNSVASLAYKEVYHGAGGKRNADEDGEIQDDDSSVDQLEEDEPAPSKSRGKRKRAKLDSDDDEDEDYVPKRKNVSPQKAQRTPGKPKATSKAPRLPSPPASNTPSSSASDVKRQSSPPPQPFMHQDRLAALRVPAYDHPPTVPGPQDWPGGSASRSASNLPIAPPPNTGNIGQSVMNRMQYTNDAGHMQPSRRLAGSSSGVAPGDRGYGQRLNR